VYVEYGKIAKNYAKKSSFIILYRHVQDMLFMTFWDESSSF